MNTSETPAGAAYFDGSRTQEAFTLLKKYVGLFGMVSAIVLATVAVVALSGHSTTSFMWIRGAILLALAPVLYRSAVRASKGARRDYERLSTLSVILPIAVLGIDLIPGLCPTWYAAMQGVSALALIGAAVITRGSVLRAAFPKNS
ncbi:hypothetical protein [Streptomyces canus]|uniref:hypothetical protein n=1 Tax=Streptomyces canus TaxID=58343 RepID=UPI00224DCFB1|nr:hypothetical protein [Streptomyces canus]MCX4852231.1 hypothetical protein [Streptomyces canus]